MRFFFQHVFVYILFGVILFCTALTLLILVLSIRKKKKSDEVIMPNLHAQEETRKTKSVNLDAIKEVADQSEKAREDIPLSNDRVFLKFLHHVEEEIPAPQEEPLSSLESGGINMVPLVFDHTEDIREPERKERRANRSDFAQGKAKSHTGVRPPMIRENLLESSFENDKPTFTALESADESLTDFSQNENVPSYESRDLPETSLNDVDLEFENMIKDSVEPVLPEEMSSREPDHALKDANENLNKEIMLKKEDDDLLELEDLTSSFQ